MVKILMGLVAAFVIAAGGFFGFEYYLQHRTLGEIEAAFDQIRVAGGKASHGKVSFDLLTRTVTVADIAAESGGQPALNVKVARLTALAVSRPDAARFAAESIEAADIEVSGAIAAQVGWRVAYKVPRITIKDYSGPAALARQPTSSSIIDLYRFSLEQFAGVSASSVEIPSIAATMNLDGAMPDGGSAAYSGLSIRGIKDGKIAAIKAESFTFTVNTRQSGKAEKLTGTVSNIASHDFDTSAVAAALDPQKATDDKYYRLYRQISTGAYALTTEPGLRMQIDGMTMDDIGVRPSRLQIAALLATLTPARATPTPAQLRETMERMAGLYEGMRVGNAEMRGLSAQTPQGPFNLSAMRFNLDNGKVGEFALEGLDARSPNGPVKIERFALKSLNIANLLRMTAPYADPAQRPSPDQALGMLAMLEGAELRGLVAPYKNTRKTVNIDAIDLSWGQFVGPFPSRARLTAKMSAPVDASDPGQMLLAAAGIDTLAIDVDLGAAWTEASGGFALDPVKIELGGLLNASARLSLANVPRGVFSLDPQQATAMAAQIEAGALELRVRDLGGVDLAVAQFARAQNLSRDAARRAIVDSIRTGGEATAGANPDTAAVVAALNRFIDNPGQTLIIKLTPRGKVPALQLLDLLQTDPVVALVQFRIEASTGL